DFLSEINIYFSMSYRLQKKSSFLEIKTKSLGAKDLVFRNENEDFFQHNQMVVYDDLFLLSGVR
ncbi:MAG: hypothetical protein SPK52_06570, partial [Synergistales bacterium]|nr:hypothetical protein [Bacteroidales bacterium]MDY6435861.1 hypothetical protein [Synergistales bacterium]MDY6393467.1 hypothetical protein [Bacteroidales bacterium]MDY6394942.1 hypothetical protein [Bacteroidales bacterium]MDY6403396.1 hypothetical protein [Bacteroidales bacterium]